MQVRELIDGSEGSGQYSARGGLIDFEFFVSLMNKKVREDDTEAELKDAFRMLDSRGQGFIETHQLREICKVRMAHCCSWHTATRPALRRACHGAA